jgi:histidinol-phosphate aminotransferase
LERTPDPDRDDATIRLNRNERLQPLPEAFLEKIRRAVKSDLFTGYPATGDLYRRLSETLGVDRAQLLLTPGSDGAIRALYQSYVQPGDAVVMLDPSYAMYAVYAHMFQAQPLTVTFDRDLGFDGAALVRLVNPEVRLVMLASPNQPTGTRLDDDLLRGVLHRAGEVGSLVAIDEAYFPFSAFTVIPWVREFPHLVVTRTFSKAAGLAGLRIGYLLGQAEVVANLARVRTAHDVNAMAVLCAREILDAPEIMAECVADTDAGRDVLVSRSVELGLHPFPSETNFLLIRLPESTPVPDVIAGLHDRGFLVRGPFDAPCLADCIRVTLGPPAVMTAFADALSDVL